MKCPYCNNEMEKGCLQIAGIMPDIENIFWTKRIRLFSGLPNEEKGDVDVPNYDSREDFEKNKIFLCRSCNKIVIDLDK